ncbi:hypothetical protein K501DRAFT_45774 [Backusella circina FSU 941]|nr:hypothetical protein K501DRAFT_45774 [Backusella circina FSU 941]
MSDQSQLVELIMELASANNKLKEDLLDCKDLLKESHNEINNLLSKLEDTEERSHMIVRRKSSQSSKSQHNNRGTELYKRGLSIRVHKNDGKNNNNFCLSSSAPEPNEESLSSRLRKMDAAKVDHLRQSESPKNYDIITSDTSSSASSSENVVPLPTSSTSLPTSTPTVVHHHYHYHMRKKTRIEKPEDHQQQQQQQQRKKKEAEVNI